MKEEKWRREKCEGTGHKRKEALAIINDTSREEEKAAAVRAQLRGVLINEAKREKKKTESENFLKEAKRAETERENK